MLLQNMMAGQNGVISKVTNLKLKKLGFKRDTSIKIASKNGNNFIVEINGTKVIITDQLSRQVSVYG